MKFCYHLLTLVFLWSQMIANKSFKAGFVKQINDYLIRSESDAWIIGYIHNCILPYYLAGEKTFFNLKKTHRIYSIHKTLGKMTISDSEVGLRIW